MKVEGLGVEKEMGIGSSGEGEVGTWRLDYGTTEGRSVAATMHTHLPETGDLIAATDICALMLYGDFAKWPQHYVFSDKNVSIWDCEKQSLLVLTRKAWDKINQHQQEKN